MICASVRKDFRVYRRNCLVHQHVHFELFEVTHRNISESNIANEDLLASYVTDCLVEDRCLAIITIKY